MAFTRKQAAGGTLTSTTVTASLTSVTAGSLLACLTGSHGAMTVADNGGNTWVDDTDRTNIPTSTKHIRWHWVLAAASGTYTVTGTSGTSGTQFIQVVEYAWPGATGTADTTDEVTAVTNGAATATSLSVTSGSGVVAGALVVTGQVDANENNETFTAGSGMTLVLDGTSKSAGQAAGAMTLIIQEQTGLSSSAGAQTANITWGTGNDAATVILAFTPPAVSVIAVPATYAITGQGSN